MSFTARAYPDVLTAILHAATHAVVDDVVTVPAVVPDGHLFFLPSSPVRRLSLVKGTVEGPGGALTPWRFSDADVELVSSTGRADELDALRFRPRRPRPAGGTVLRVSYWPREVPPLPLTDLGVGSVTRTLLETLAREVADAEAQLQVVYDSAFVETATGRSLDKVVGLLGIDRRPADVPVGKVRLHRRPGTAGLVTIAVGTVLLTREGDRYLTTREATLHDGESSVEIPVAGEGPATPPVPVGALDRPAQALAGVDAVRNDSATYRPTEQETDDALRARARRSFHGVGVGTLDALVHGLTGLPGVSGVQVTEFPDGRPGVVDLDVALTQPDDPAQIQLVEESVQRLRPAGIRVTWRTAARADVTVDITRLQLTGRARPVAELEDIRAGLTARLVKALTDLPPGGRLEGARAAALALADERIADIAIGFGVAVAAPSPAAVLPPATAARPVTPFALPPATYTDEAGPAAPVQLLVRVMGPVQLMDGTTLAEASEAVRGRTAAWLAGTRVLDHAAFAAAVRDDARYALVLEEVALVLERDGRFEQLVLGSPARPLALGETAVVTGVLLEAA
jgi:Baseplate J-like protein